MIKDSTEYNAYILTIIADSAYVKNDLSKLSHNTYRKHDADFSGLVLYSTPNGEYLGGYTYKDGQLLTPTLTPQSAATPQKVQSIGKGIKPNSMVMRCVDWYTKVTYTYEDGHTWVSQDWTYDKTVCTLVNEGGGTIDGGTGTGGSPGSSSPPPLLPPPCPAGSHSGPPVVQPCIPRNVESAGAGAVKANYVQPPPADGGMPSPTSQTCSVDAPRVPCPPVALVKDIIINLSNPCLSNIANQLKSNSTIQTQVTNVLRNTFGVNNQVNITFTQADLTRTNVGQGSASTSGSQLNNLDVVFNTPVIANASKEYLTEVFMHEIYHAYLYVNPAVRGNLSQHLYMAQNYINAEVTSLRNIYTTLSQHDALCLVISGYGDLQTADPNAFNAVMTAYNLTLNDIVNTNNTFKNGTKGTHC